MATGKRPWPDVAKEARDRSAEEANGALRTLRPLLEDRVITRDELSRRVALSIDALQTILRLMEAQGAPTLP